MSWLRAFSAFRDLEARYKSQKGVIQKLEAQLDRKNDHLARIDSQLDAANGRMAELMDRLDEARKSHIKATETVADFGFQLKYGRKLFDHVPELPEAPPEIPFEGIRKLRPQGRDLVADAERKFYEALNDPPKTQ